MNWGSFPLSVKQLGCFTRPYGQECFLTIRWLAVPRSVESPFSQVEEFKYLGAVFESEGRMEQEIGRWIDAAVVVLSVVVKKAPSQRRSS